MSSTLEKTHRGKGITPTNMNNLAMLSERKEHTDMTPSLFFIGWNAI